MLYKGVADKFGVGSCHRGRYGRFMRSKVPLLLLCMLTGCATMHSRERPNALEYGCGDLVVVGRIITIGEQGIYGSDALPNWRSEYQLQVRIKRV